MPPTAVVVVVVVVDAGVAAPCFSVLFDVVVLVVDDDDDDDAGAFRIEPPEYFSFARSLTDNGVCDDPPLDAGESVVGGLCGR